MYFVALIVLPALALAQTCTDAGYGPCLNGACPPGAVCLADDTCCDSTLTSIAIPTTTVAPTTAAAAVTTAAVTDATVLPTVTVTCVDKTNPSTGRSDCPNRTAYCNNAIYFDLMTAQCPATCGRCGAVTSAATTTSTTTCVDKLNPSTGVSDCPNRQSLCEDSNYYTLMTEQCPNTCNRCPGTATTVSASCVDKLNPTTGVSDCPNRTNLCQDSNYYQLMTEQCPKTCGRC